MSEIHECNLGYNVYFDKMKYFVNVYAKLKSHRARAKKIGGITKKQR